jgi:soluble epoxide hydrolase/lipid-phosphate phosphatase
MRPDIFQAVVGLVVPVCCHLSFLPLHLTFMAQYIPAAGSYVSVKQYVPVIPKLAYQTYFDRQTQDAANELNRDIRRTLRATMRTISSPPPDDFLKSETSYLEGWKAFVEVVSLHLCIQGRNAQTFPRFRLFLS